MCQKFRLFSLPKVALKQVFEMMNPVDLVELSFCSKSTKLEIRSATIRMDMLTMSSRSFEMEFKKTNQLVDWNFGKCIGLLEDHRKIGDARFICWSKQNYEIDEKSISTISCIASNFHSAILTIFKYLDSLFIISSYSYTTYGYKNTFFDDFLEFLPKKCANFELKDESTTSEDVYKVLDHFNILGKLEAYVGGAQLFLHEKMSSVEELVLNGVDQSFLFGSIDPIKLTIGANILSDENLNRLCKNWVYGEKRKRENMKILKIKRNDSMSGSIELVLRGLPSRKDSGNFYDIQRICDGRLASVGFTDSDFLMIVY
uniref:F-box domain-containing protein n=1 Tax=Caenorhabditis japonica TaxID=281687 RepID=A0A8R1DHF7_CAEJA